MKKIDRTHRRPAVLSTHHLRGARGGGGGVGEGGTGNGAALDAMNAYLNGADPAPDINRNLK